MTVMTPYKDVIISRIRCLDIRYLIEIEWSYIVYMFKVKDYSIALNTILGGKFFNSSKVKFFQNPSCKNWLAVRISRPSVLAPSPRLNTKQ